MGFSDPRPLTANTSCPSARNKIRFSGFQAVPAQLLRRGDNRVGPESPIQNRPSSLENRRNPAPGKYRRSSKAPGRRISGRSVQRRKIRLSVGERAARDSSAAENLRWRRIANVSWSGSENGTHLSDSLRETTSSVGSWRTKNFPSVVTTSRNGNVASGLSAAYCVQRFLMQRSKVTRTPAPPPPQPPPSLSRSGPPPPRSPSLLRAGDGGSDGVA